MSATQQLRSVATTLTGADLAKIAKQTAAEAGPATVKSFFEANKNTLTALLPKHFDADRMLKLALGALRTTPKLAHASNASLLGAVVTCSQLGLEPNTPLGHAYLLPFDKRQKINGEWVTVETQVTIIIGYKGMLDLARRSGQIVSISAHEVCENDEFRFAYGLDEELTHRPAMSDRGAVIGFYAVAKLVGGGHCFEYMSVDEVNFIRDKAAEKNRVKKDGKGNYLITGPWLDNYVEMGRKTALRRLFKYLPISVENLAFADALDGKSVAQPTTLDDMVFDVTEPEQEPEDTPEDSKPAASSDGDKQKPAAEQQQPADGAPTFEDAMASIKSGDFDMAQDIARGLAEGQRKQIEVAIKNAQGGDNPEESENPDPQQSSGRRGRGQMPLD